MPYTRDQVISDLNLYFERLAITMSAAPGTGGNVIVITRPERITGIQDHQVKQAIDKCVTPEGFEVEWRDNES